MVKLNPNDSFARLKARLMVKGYSQMYIDYLFISSFRLLLPIIDHYITWYQECFPSWYCWWRGL